MADFISRSPTPQESEEACSPEKPGPWGGNPYIRAAILGVTVCTITLILTLGFIVALFFMKDTASAIIRTRGLSYRDGDQVIREIVEEYPEDVIQYTARYPDGDIIVIDDFGRRLTILKAKEWSYCLVKPLNESRSISIETMKLASQMSQPSNREYIVLQVDERPIENHALLGPHAGRMCKEVPLYWAISERKGNTFHRVRRETPECKCYKRGQYKTSCFCPSGRM